MISQIKQKRFFLNSTETPLRFQVLALAYFSAIVALSIYYGLTIWLYLPMILLAGFFIFISAKMGLGLIIILTMIFERFFTLAPLIFNDHTYKIYPLDIFIALTFFSLLGEWLLKSKDQKQKISIDWPEIALITFIVINILNYFRSIIGANTDLAVAFSTLKNYAFYPLLYLLTFYLVETKEDLKKIIHWLFWGGIAIIGFIAFGFISGVGLWTQFTPLSTGGVRYLAGTHAFYLTLSTIIALSLLSFDRFWHRPLMVGVVWLWIVGILGSLMRHLWLGLATGVISLIILSLPKNSKRLINYFFRSSIVIFSIIIITFLAIQIFPNQTINSEWQKQISSVGERFVSFFQSQEDSSINWRLNFWQEAFHAWKNNALLGVGLGKEITISVDGWQTTQEIRNIHNSLLSILIQNGILGLLAIITLIFTTLAKSFRSIYSNQETAPYYIGIMSGLVIILIASLFQPYLETNLNNIFFWIFLGLLATSRKFNHYENITNQ